MKWLTILKSTVGKVTMTTQKALLISAGVGVGATLIIQNAATVQAERELAVRSVSSISNPYNYEGMRRGADNNMTSINVKDGRNQIASREERERLEGYRRRGFSDETLRHIDNLDATVSGAFGRANTMGDSEALTMGSNETDEIPSGSAGNSGVSFRAPGIDLGGGEGSNGAGGAGPSRSRAAGRPVGEGGSGSGAQLANASMARASGTGIGASGAGGGSGNEPRSLGRGGAGRDGYQFSGAMPSGSNLVSARAEALGTGNGMGNPNFLASSRGSRTYKGRQTPRGDTELKDITKRSAAAARNSERSNNEGARAFMANSTESGGMQFEGATDATTSGSADFEAPNAARLKGIKDWGNTIDTEALERSKRRNEIIMWLLGTVVATALAIPFGYHLINKGRSSGGFWGVAMMIAGFVLLAAAAAVATTLIVKAAKFAHDYTGGTTSTVSYIVGGVAIGALIFTGIAAMSNQQSPLHKFMDKAMGKMRHFMGDAIKGAAVSTALSTGKEALANAMNDDGQGAENNKHDNNNNGSGANK